MMISFLNWSPSPGHGSSSAICIVTSVTSLLEILFTAWKFPILINFSVPSTRILLFAFLTTLISSLTLPCLVLFSWVIRKVITNAGSPLPLAFSPLITLGARQDPATTWRYIYMGCYLSVNTPKSKVIPIILLYSLLQLKSSLEQFKYLTVQQNSETGKWNEHPVPISTLFPMNTSPVILSLHCR